MESSISSGFLQNISIPALFKKEKGKPTLRWLSGTLKPGEAAISILVILVSKTQR